MAWMYLMVAGVFEAVWAISMKFTDGFTKFIPSAITIIGMVLSVVFLGLALKELPLGTAYAIWTGIGVISTVVAGILLFNEPKELARLVFIMFILIGIAGLKVVSKT